MSHLLWFLLLTVSVAAQPNRRQAELAPRPLRELQVDVEASDSTDVPAANLTAADLELTVDGKPQAITGFTQAHQQPRRIVVVVDDAGMSARGVLRVKSALLRFLGEEMRADDEAAILRTRSGSGVLEKITSDKSVLSDALEQIRFDPREYGAAGAAITVRRALVGLRAIPGRKAVVLISENLALAQRRQNLYEGFGALAAEASVVFYTADPRDPSERTEPGLLPLAGETGGLNLGSELSRAIVRVLRDQEGCYLVSFQEDSSAIALHQTQVRSRNAALVVRSRVRPLGTGAPAPEFRAGTELQELARGLSSPFSASAIRVQVSPLYGYGTTLASTVAVLVWVDVSALTFTHLLDGVHQASGEVLVSAYSDTGMSSDSQGLSFTLRLPSADYETTLRQGWLCRMDVQAPKPGTYQVRALVRDGTSSRMGSAHGLTEIPDLAPGEPLLSDIVIRVKGSTSTTTGPGRRIFAPGDTLAFDYSILSPSSGPAPPAELQTEVRVFREDVEVFSGKPQILPAKTLEDPMRRPMTGEVTLTGQISAGHYYLQITITEKQSNKLRQARRSIDFEVRR